MGDELDAFIQRCVDYLNTALKAKDEKRYDDLREAFRGLQAAIPDVWPMVNEAQGLARFRKPDIFSGEDGP